MPPDDDAPAQVRPRSPALAALFSLVVPGLGHHYAGLPRLAKWVAAAFGIGGLALQAGVVAAEAGLALVGGSIALVLLVRVAILVDAARRAAAAGADYALRPCNQPSAYAWFLLWALVVVVVPSELRSMYVIGAYKVPSGSNIPTLEPGEHFLVTKLAARDRHPGRGDIVVFPHPADPEEVFIKRIVALPGETIEVREGVVSIDGEPLPQEIEQTTQAAQLRIEHAPPDVHYRIQLTPIPAGNELEHYGPLRVPDGHVFVLGDNRNRSHDSREFGPIPLDTIIGRARFVWLPFDRARELE